MIVANASLLSQSELPLDRARKPLALVCPNVQALVHAIGRVDTLKRLLRNAFCDNVIPKALLLQNIQYLCQTLGLI